ncbi:MAG: DUF4493 domain-containing protein [Rikenellaceae bacterium]|nr:DUF4493 domain-containing protein [Rikenellaceae bacterium]MBQ8745809.1 DUF4493 domain-containing protein [Rikenellaceae bacterium]
MKLFRLISTVALALTIGLVGCERDKIGYGDKEGATGTLSFMQFGVETSTDIEIISRAATSATYNYVIRIFDANGDQVGSDYIYGQMPESIVLNTGTYSMKIQSQSQIPSAEFEAPVYGATVNGIVIEEDQTTDLGVITCKLINIKVSVGYNEAMWAVLGDDANVLVEIGDGALNFAKGESQNGYFAAPEVSNAMTVKFSGTVDGNYATMTRAFTDVKAGQWRKINFIMTVNEEGDATFDVVVEDWCDEKELANNIEVSEEVIGPDPDAGEGEEENPDAPKVIYKGGSVPTSPIVITDGMELGFTISAPKGIAGLSVDIASTNADFNNDVLSAGISPIDLVNPSEAQISICDMFGLSYGSNLVGQTEVAFNLTGAVTPLLGFPGTHSFTLTITDAEGNSTSTTIKMKVNE